MSPIEIGLSGYKEIHIKDDSDIYVIKHYYTPSKETHSIKSYISKNGVELNENGNVTSFKALVNEYLDLDQDFLKLIRLGSNVTNFIDMKTTDRKNFMGKLLDDIDLYLKYFKKTTNDIRDLKSLLSHTTDKLNKLNVSSIEELNLTISSIDEKISIISTELVELQSRESVLTYQLSNLPDKDDIIYNLKDYKEKNNKLVKKISNGDFKRVTSDDITKIKESILTLTAKLDSSIEKRKIYIEDLDRLMISKKDIETDLEKEEQNEYVNSLISIIKELNEYVNEKEPTFIGYNPSYTSNDVETVINALYSAQTILDRTYEFGKGPITKVVKQLKKNRSVPEFVNEKLAIIEANKLNVTGKYVLDKVFAKMNLVYPNCDKPSKCPIYRAWTELTDMASTKTVDNDIQDEDFYNYMNLAYSNIKAAISELNKHKDTINKMPQVIKEMMRLDNFYSNISDLKVIYDIKQLYDLLSVIKEYELFIEKRRLLLDKEYELSVVMQSSNKEKLKKRLSEISENIDSRSEDISSLSETIDTLRMNIKTMSDLLDDMISTKELLDNADEIRNKFEEYQKIYDDFISLTKELSSISDSINACNLDLSKLHKEQIDTNLKIREFKSLTKDLKKLNKHYDDAVLIRQSLSAKEGMPLLHIKIYLKNTTKITNQLLDIVYGGRLYLDQFDITENEFSIPYFTKNKRIEDAIHASQGERSFISLALSFALSYQSLSMYNIMLLDEVDSTLDTENRMKFIAIVQKLIDMINGEQIFIITHNNMFDMYPVDIISLSGQTSGNNKLANYVKINTV